MAITISGDGTISGISAGGLPDGSVTAADLADTYLTGVTSSTMPSGSILNVYSVEKTDVWSKTGWGMADITGLSITVNPVSSSSKFLVTYNVRASSDYWKTYVNLLRNGTVLFANGAGAGDNRSRTTSAIATQSADSNSHGFMHDHTLTILDSPATSSAVTYKLQGSGRVSSYIMYVNRSIPDRTVTEYDDRMVSNMLVLEVAG